jgi:class 3 adenylate cyclase
MIESEAMKISSTSTLLEALDTRGTTEEARKKFDTEVWNQCGQYGAILVTDLTGFTKSTKRYGILQFLSVFRRFQKICGPKLSENGGELLKQEADDLFGVFPHSFQAITAAKQMLENVRELNKSLAPEDQMGLSVGIDYGHFLRLSDDAYGDPVNVAFKLGEDIAATGEIRVGKEGYEEAEKSGSFPPGLNTEGPVTTSKSGASMEHYILTLA